MTTHTIIRILMGVIGTLMTVFGTLNIITIVRRARNRE